VKPPVHKTDINTRDVLGGYLSYC